MRRLPIYLLIPSLFINILGISAFFYVAERKGGVAHILSNSIAQPIVNPLRIGLFKTYSTKNKVVFLGDSITQNCEWAELLGNPDIVNRGISGDTTSGVLGRLTEIHNPAKVFIMIGINDFIKGISVDEVFENYKKIVASIRDKSPGAKIYVQETLPINYSKQGKKVDNRDVARLNQLLASIDGVTIINMDSMIENAQLKDAFSDDGLHPNADGYLAWKETVLPFVKE